MLQFFRTKAAVERFRSVSVRGRRTRWHVGALATRSRSWWTLYDAHQVLLLAR